MKWTPRVAIGWAVVVVTSSLGVTGSSGGSPLIRPVPDRSPAADGGSGDHLPRVSAERGAGDVSEARYESEAVGVSFDLPAGLRPADGVLLAQDEVARWIDPDGRRVLSLRKIVLDRTVPLTSDRVDGRTRVGMLETIAAELAGGGVTTTVRQEAVNLNGASAGLVGVLHSAGATPVLTQQAVIRAADTLYYVLSYTTPAPGADDPAALERDARVTQDVAAFEATADSFRLLDGTAIRRDQEDRLFRTRTLFVNLTPERLTASLRPRQWLRIVRDGRDVGYSFVVEEIADGLPGEARAIGDDRPTARRGGAEEGSLGVRVGVRSRTLPHSGVRVDAESWLWTTFDRRRETWSNLAVVHRDDARGGEEDSDYSNEIGTSLLRDRPIPVPALQGGGRGEVNLVPDYRLTVRRFGKTADAPEIERQLPPFYLPQALTHLLPRLVAGEAGGRRGLGTTQPRTYLFAAYVADRGEVMARYVDVLPERSVELDGRQVRAVPVLDRLGLEGDATTHYVHPETGEYLGSVSESTRVQVLPTDERTLLSLWDDADLSRPQDPGQNADRR